MINSEKTLRSLEDALNNFEHYLSQQFIADGLPTESLIIMRHKISLLNLELIKIFETCRESRSDSKSSPNNIHININIGSNPNDCST